MLKIKDLSVKVEGKTILDNINLSIGDGEIVAVMGPNGSGKTTLAYTIAGHPKYEIYENGKNAKIEVNGAEIKGMTPDERAKEGLFLATQYPVAVPGLSTGSFLWQIYKNRTRSLKLKAVEKRIGIIEFRKWIAEQAKALGLKPELLKRGINDGFSGGEKKKMEILQMLVFNPKVLILDEIDSGLDIEALKKIALTVLRVAKEKKMSVLVITHYSRLLNQLRPDKVVVLKGGKVVAQGNESLVSKIEEEGYDFGGK